MSIFITAKDVYERKHRADERRCARVRKCASTNDYNALEDCEWYAVLCQDQIANNSPTK